MSWIDWAVLLVTTAFIVAWGIWRFRGAQTMGSYLKGGSLSWSTIGISVMATQASAITFLSVPGQAYDDGMRFVQFYFGLPLAMVLIAAVFVPLYYRLKVFTAYEYLESRFDLRVRLLGAFLFLVSRALATGISLYAPAILLSAILGWPLAPTLLIVGIVVIVYTVIGGSRAVSQTQKQQMAVILVGMVAAGITAALSLPQDVSLGDALHVAGALGRTQTIDLTFDPANRYNLWSGIIGGFFLQLSYFGTDQSQVQRYLGGADTRESRLGLMFNAVLKIPMQAGILFIGVIVFALYVFAKPPLLWNEPALDAARRAQPTQTAALERAWDEGLTVREGAARSYLAALDTAAEPAAKEALVQAQAALDADRTKLKASIKEIGGIESEDRDHIFLSFALEYLPPGLLGLLIAVVLCAVMSSLASALSALGTTTVVDFHRRLARTPPSEAQTVRISKGYTVMWGAFAIGFAALASAFDNLIQAVNILGSLVYGTILGLFLTAFFLKRVGSRAVFIGALVSEGVVIFLYAGTEVAFLWYNVIGALVVMAIGLVLSFVWPTRAAVTS